MSTLNPAAQLAAAIARAEAAEFELKLANDWLDASIEARKRQDAELAELRAYRDRTEAALAHLAALPIHLYGRIDLEEHGLWRAPGSTISGNKDG
jgi:hypothetical protein